MTNPNEYRHMVLTSILADERVVAENGEAFTTFESAGRDSADFATVNRATLHRLMQAAYEAGTRHQPTPVADDENIGSWVETPLLPHFNPDRRGM